MEQDNTLEELDEPPSAEDEQQSVPFHKRQYTSSKFWNYINNYLEEARQQARKGSSTLEEMSAIWTQ
jgi:hypothetical protein